MNSFEKYTLVIGTAAILIEAIKKIAARLKIWFSYHAKP